ncbi:hypothetical protein M5D96_011559, partial [Drosophila gunungcola]
MQESTRSFSFLLHFSPLAFLFSIEIAGYSVICEINVYILCGFNFQKNYFNNNLYIFHKFKF